MVTVWTPGAEAQLLKAYLFILKDSPQNAQKVKDQIIDLSIQLAQNPERFPLDKYRRNNDGSFRALEIYRYRVSYRVQKDYILIVRLRHTGMTPQYY
jgi:plasmid stabilization system protein ParE